MRQIRVRARLSSDDPEVLDPLLSIVTRALAQPTPQTRRLERLVARLKQDLRVLFLRVRIRFGDDGEERQLGDGE